MNINPKVTAATVAGAVTTIIVWLLTFAGIDMPVVVQGAITSILVFTAGYLTPASNESGAHEA